jgi:hypothetical protein
MDRIGWRRIVKELGRGAMGVVYHAIDPHIGRPAAIRTIQPGTLRKPEEQDDRANAPFARRARPVFASRHRHDLRHRSAGGLAYIAMEYADGPTLDEVLSASQPIASDKIQCPRAERRGAPLRQSERDRASGYQAGQHHDRLPPILFPTSSILGAHVAISSACGRHEPRSGRPRPIAPLRSASVADCRSRGRRLKTDFVVDCISEPLLAAEVAFRCLNADVAEQELNLFKLPTGLMT